MGFGHTGGSYRRHSGGAGSRGNVNVEKYPKYCLTSVFAILASKVFHKLNDFANILPSMCR